MKLVFMGTPDIARACLAALIDSSHEVVGVVTRPDRPAGRGRNLEAPPVKQLALKHDIPVLQPSKVNAPETLDRLRALEPDALAVVAFGAILRKPLLELTHIGSVNVHASLLPAYRGVAPVQWALIHGHRVTGVTTMLMDEGVDTGPMLLRRPMEVGPFETAGDVLDRMGRVGGELLIETLTGLGSGTLKPVAQPEGGASYAPKVLKHHGNLDFTRSCHEVVNQYRGTTPAPGARFYLGDEAVRVGSMRPVAEAGGEPYTVLEIDARHLRVATGTGAVDLIQVRPPGKGDMDGAAFARGRRLEPGDRLSPPADVPDLDLLVPVSS